MTFTTWLREQEACIPARNFAVRYATAYDAWMACRDMNHLLWLIETFTMYFLEPDSRQLYWLAAEFLRNAPASASSHESLFDLVNDDARTAVTLLEDHADGAPNQFEINEAAERLNRMVSSWPTGS